jgi:putative ABC transport system permease protein
MNLKFIIRNLKERPFLNLIRIIGLSLALSCILLIVLFLKNELTFDNYHKNSDRIYRFTITNSGILDGKHFARVYNSSFIPEMAGYFPEIEKYVRLAPIRDGVIKHGEDFIEINETFLCDSTFFEMFDADLLVGNPENILDGPGSMVVSESFAKKAFGKSNPVGQILTLPAGQFNDKNADYTVKGIMKDFPQKSHFHPEFIATPVVKNLLDDWAWTYLLMAGNADPEKLVSGFKNFYSSNISGSTEEEIPVAHLQKITDIHLHSNKLREIEPNRDMSVIYTFSVAALILLLIALANYANLSIGMAYFSDKYLFISKVSGSSGWTTLKYFLSEGIIVATVSSVISLLIVSVSDIAVRKHFALDLFSGNTHLILSVIILFGLFVILAGILPILKQVINNVKPFTGYNGNNNLKRKGISKSIIVLQYTISIALIVAVIVIRNQTNFALRSSMGFNNNNMICFENVFSNVQQKFEVFKEELLKYNSIESVSAMLEPPGGEANDMFEFKMEGYIPDKTKNADNMIGVFPCDCSMARTFKLKFLSGNDFSERNVDNAGSGEYIINRSALRKLNYTNPDEIIGKSFELIFKAEGIMIPAGKIIGVVEDFHLSSIRKAVEPLVLFKRKDLWLMNLVVSPKPDMQTQALTDIKKVWTKLFPEYPFQYEYVSSMYEDVYKGELLQARLLTFFTVIALFICSMGLLGLSLLTAQRRTKEIGIRKINGATIGEILIMLNRNLLKWIMISFILAIPLAYIFMNKWMEAFAYKTALSVWIFALAGLTALLIAMITVSVQSWKAASRNPVESLRYE